MHPLDPLIEIVEKILYIPEGSIKGPSRIPRIRKARALVVVIAVDCTDLTNTDIGEAICRSRTNVNHLLARYRPEVEHSEKLKAIVKTIRETYLLNPGCWTILKEEFFTKPPAETTERSVA